MANADTITLARDNASKQNSPAMTAGEECAIYRAMGILETHMRRASGEVFNTPSAVRKFLTLKLAREESEQFVVMFLDTQHRLIEAETLFYGTLSQASVYPREVVKRARNKRRPLVLIKVDTNVLINLRRRYQMKQRIPNAIYSKEFREQAVKRVQEEGLSAEAVGKTQHPLTEMELELTKVKRELAEVKMERDLLKKSGGVLCKGNKVKYAMMKQLRADYHVPLMCRIDDVSPSGYYVWQGRLPSKRMQEDARLGVAIKAAHQSTRETYDSAPSGRVG